MSTYSASLMASLAAPAPYKMLMEMRAPLEWASIAPALPYLLAAKRGDQRHIMLAPGFMADELSMWPLAQFLRWLNYRVHQWGLGTNRGNVLEDAEHLGNKVQHLAEQTGAPVTLIGWSLGGVIAREVARARPSAAREVITLGSPITGGPKYTVTGDLFARQRNIDLDELEQMVLQRNQQGLSQPVTSIYSKSDGVVGWQAAIDHYNPQAKNVEVNGSHCGLGGNPRVWRIIADTLSGTRL